MTTGSASHSQSSDKMLESEELPQRFDSASIHNLEPAAFSSTNSETNRDFDENQCLFCPQIQPDLDINLTHMYKSHGLFIPDQDHLLVDIPILLSYFHLIISNDFQCLYCGTQRRTAEAAQQHMLAKSHCRIDIESEDSEFRDFYDWDGEDVEGDDTMFDTPFVQPDEGSLRLASGKIVSHRSIIQHRPGRTPLEAKPTKASLEFSPSASQDDPNSSSNALKKGEKRNISLNTQLTQLRASDRTSLMHLPTAQQRAILTTQGRQLEKAKRAERRMQSRVSRAGNKTLMAHFVPDTPGRSNG